MDLQEIDSIEHVNPEKLPNVINRDVFESYNDNLKQQYVEFINLGSNILENVEDELVMSLLLKEFLEHVHNHFSPILDYYENQLNTNFINLGKQIYEFFCVDCYTTIIPGFLENIKVINLEEFERYYSKKLNNTPAYFKGNFVKSIQNIEKNIQNLKSLDKNIKYDKNYQKLLSKYNFYVQLMNFGHIDNFLENYFKPVLAKNESDIVWRVS